MNFVISKLKGIGLFGKYSAQKSGHVLFWTLTMIGTGLLPGCSDWPPQEDEYSTNFSNHFDEFVALDSAMQKTAFDAAYFSITPGSIRVTYESGPSEIVSLDNDQAREIRKLLESTSVIGAFRYSNLMVFEAAPLRLRHTMFLVSYNRGLVRSQLGSCEAVSKTQESGNCYSALDENWWLEYRWKKNNAQ